MAGDLNRATIIGRLGGDPDVRTMGSGSKVCTFSVATSERWKGRDGEPKEKTEWHRVVIWNEGLVSVAERFLRKGSRVMVEGHIETREYEGQDGVERKTTEIVLRFDAKLILLGDKGEGGGNGGDGGGRRDGGSSQRQGGGQRSGGGGGYGGGGRGGPANNDDMDDEIPF